MNTPNQCGIGRHNIIIKPGELFEWTTSPTNLHALRIDSELFLIHRDASNHPHFAPMLRDGDGTWFTQNIDGVRFEPTTITDAMVGDKVAFDHKGDVWTIEHNVTASGPRYYFGEC